jgi:ATP-dependent helicase/nuclease subunit B
MVLPRLAEYLGSPLLAAKGKLPLSPIFESAAIQHVADKMSRQQPLGDIANHPKLHQSLLNTFKELDRLSLTSLAKLAAADPLRSQTVKWYRAVRDLTAKYYTREELTSSAAYGLTQNKDTSALSDLGFIIFYLVSDLSPAEIELVIGLYKLAQSAVIFGVTGEDAVDNRLKRLILKLEPDYKISSDITKPIHSSVEHAVIAHNYQEEVKWIVRHILCQAKNGIPFHRMAILYHDPYPYAEHILQQLRTAGIPSAGPSTSLIKNTPPGKLVIHFLEVIKNDFARDEFMHWIAESPVKAVPDNISAQAELAKWEIISRNAGIVKGAEQWRQRLNAYRHSLTTKIEGLNLSEETSPSELNGLKEESRSLESLSRLIDKVTSISIPPEGSSYATFAGWIVGLIDEYAYDPAHWPADGQKVLERIKELIDQIGSLDDLIPGGITLDGFTTLVGNALETSIGRTGVTGEGLFVAPVASVAGMNFEVVYITGMSEGAFPPRPHIDPLLSDNVRQILSGDDALPLSSERNIEERRHYLAALASGKTCVLSFSRTNAGAERGQYPSPWFLQEIEKLNGGALNSAEIDNLGNKPWISVIFSSEHALQYAECLTPMDSHDYDMASLARWRGNHQFTQPHFLLSETTPAGRAIKMEKARHSSEFSAWDGNLTSMAGKCRLLGLPGNSHFSPTRLEKWAGCPMSYFLGHILEIPVYEKPEEIITIQAKDRGSLVHSILERFIHTLFESKQLPDYGEPWNNQHEPLLFKIAHEEFARIEKLGITGQRLMWTMVREEIEQDLIEFLAEDSGLRAASGLKTSLVEQSFGMGRKGDLPAVKIRVNNQEISLHGFIDRVDSNRDGNKYLIIDYKTGSASSYSGMKKDPLECGRRLQLPVYGLAIRQSLETQAEITACYWFISNKGNFERREVLLSAVEKEFLEKVELIAAGIQKGLFIANPGDNGSDNCRYCDFDRICPPDRDLIWERKSAVPELERYRKLNNSQTTEGANQ